MFSSNYFKARKIANKDVVDTLSAICFACGLNTTFVALDHNLEVIQNPAQVVSTQYKSHFITKLSMLNYSSDVVDNTIYVRKGKHSPAGKIQAIITIVEAKNDLKEIVESEEAIKDFERKHNVHMLANIYSDMYAYEGIKEARHVQNNELVSTDTQPRIYYTPRRVAVFVREQGELAPTDVYKMY